MSARTLLKFSARFMEYNEIRIQNMLGGEVPSPPTYTGMRTGTLRGNLH